MSNSEIKDSIHKRLVQLRAAFKAEDAAAVEKLSSPFSFESPSSYEAFLHVVQGTSETMLPRLAGIFADNAYGSGITYSHLQTTGDQPATPAPL